MTQAALDAYITFLIGWVVFWALFIGLYIFIYQAGKNNKQNRDEEIER